MRIKLFFSELPIIVDIEPFKRQPLKPTNYLSKFDHFMWLALKGLKKAQKDFSH